MFSPPNLVARQALQKTAVFLLALFCLFCFSEAALRSYGFLIGRTNARRNAAAMLKNGTVRILCIGDSMTFGGYPRYLQQKLDSFGGPVKFSVIDRGEVETDSTMARNSLESDLDAYKPNIVLAMLGGNDLAPERIMRSSGWLSPSVLRFVRSLRTYKLIHYTRELLLKHSLPDREVSVRDIQSLLVCLLAEKSVFAATPSAGPATANNILAALEKALLSSPDKDNVERWQNLVQYYRQQQSSFKAGVPFRPAGRLSESDFYALCDLADSYLADRREELARELLDQAALINSANSRLYELRAQLHRQTNDYKQALVAIKKAVALSPSKAYLWSELGYIQRALGNTDEAIAAYRQAIAKDKKHGGAYSALCQLYAVDKPDRTAFHGLVDAMFQAKLDNVEDFTYCASVACLLFLLEDEDRLFLEALRLDPKNPEMHKRRGQRLLGMRKYLLARQHLELARSMAPDDPSINGNLSLANEHLGLKTAPLAGVDHRRESNPPILVENYLAIKKLLDNRSISLVAMQYPLRDIALLKDIFRNEGGVFFVSNENFGPLVKKDGHVKYFMDLFAGDFGHCTEEGNRLIADNAAQVILREVLDSHQAR